VRDEQDEYSEDNPLRKQQFESGNKFAGVDAKLVVQQASF
jgi:hypothetical protein